VQRFVGSRGRDITWANVTSNVIASPPGLTLTGEASDMCWLGGPQASSQVSYSVLNRRWLLFDRRATRRGDGSFMFRTALHIY
jgi:hypothetical protein